MAVESIFYSVAGISCRGALIWEEAEGGGRQRVQVGQQAGDAPQVGVEVEPAERQQRPAGQTRHDQRWRTERPAVGLEQQRPGCQEAERGERAEQPELAGARGDRIAVVVPDIAADDHIVPTAVGGLEAHEIDPP